ncbi:hypothetical protein PUN28_001648 [Cardiocondyla obscurior]|uniref:Uncharacterized protein n=1 Tax=Cardiocondyla obscurior TaxID=286306 RepID=A0AAW2GQJ8_9HYME
MAKLRNKKIAKTNDNSNLKTLELPNCMVVLIDIALDKDLVQHYKLQFTKKKTKNLCTCNLPSNSNKRKLKENVPDINSRNDTCLVTRSQLKKLSTQNNKKCKIHQHLDNGQQRYNLRKSESAQKQHLKHNRNVKLFSSTSNDEMSSNFSSTFFNSTSEEIISIHNKKKSNGEVQRKNGFKRKLSFQSETSSESVKVIYNDNILHTKKVSINENKKPKHNDNHVVEVPQTKDVTECSSIEKKNNLHAGSIGNGNVSESKLEQCQINTSKDNLSNNFLNSHNDINNLNKSKKIATSSSDTSITTCSTIQVMDYSESLVLKPIFPTISKTNHIIQISPNVLTCNEIQCTSDEKTKKSLPKITGDYILPKDAIKITQKKITSDENLKNSFFEQNFLDHNRYNNTNNNVNQVSCTDNTLESTKIIKKHECHTSKTNSSINKLKIPEFTPTLNNNIDLKNKNIDSDKLHNVKIDHKNDSLTKIRNNTSRNENVNDINSKTSETYKNCILNEQKELNKLNNDEMLKSDMLQDDKCNKNSDKTKNTLNLVDIRKNCNVNKPLVTVDQKIVKQNRKRTASENTTDTIINNKKQKLNRSIWIQNNVPRTRSVNDEENNEVSDISSMTIESTVVEKLDSSNQKLDLRDCLNNKTIKKVTKSLTSKNEINNKNNVELEQKTNFDKALDEESASNNTSLNEEEDNQSEDTDSHDCDYISLFADSDMDFLENTNCDEQDRLTNEPEIIQSQVDKPQMSESQMDKPQISESKVNKFQMSGSRIDESQSNRTRHLYTSHYMSGAIFDKYVTQNVTEFNDEYAKYADNNIQIANKPDEIKKEFSNKLEQTTHTNYIPKTKCVSYFNYSLWVKRLLYGYCFQFLKDGRCTFMRCKFKMDLRDLIDVICLKDSETLYYAMQYLLKENYIFLFKKIYAKSLNNFTKDNILRIFTKFHESEVTQDDKRQIVRETIEHLLNIKMPLKIIVNSLVECITSTADLNNYINIINIINILNCASSYIKEGEYWETIKTSILSLPPNKNIIEKILSECISNERLTDIQAINKDLLNDVSFEFLSSLNENLLNRFKNLLFEKTANNSNFVLKQNVKGNSYVTIASPDGNTNLSQTENMKTNNNVANTSANVNDSVPETNGEVYRLQPIENLSDAQSVYRDHPNFWKFYADLDRFKRGLLHEDYNYVINILKFYAEKQDESPLFVRSCCKILQREIDRSAHHLKNIVSQAVQMDTFTILGKMLFQLTLGSLTSLINMETWGLALKLIQSLAMYNLPYNAEYLLLSAEIYLANKQALEAYELLKQKSIIHTNCEKWRVENTIEDQHVRNKVMQILMDSLCNDFIEYAFFLFQFLLKDQSSQYYPIDLSLYVNKLIIIFLSKEDSNLIIQMANLVLKYTFELNKTTGRALTSALIHLDENLARQMYNYAENIGIYSAIKLWPITCIIINNDLTEEEIYLIFLQTLRSIVFSFGHAIEFARPNQIKVYINLEITSTIHFYCAKLQKSYNDKAINNIKKLIRQVLQKRFDPPILLMRGSKGRTYKLQSKSVLNYLKTEHCN